MKRGKGEVGVEGVRRTQRGEKGKGGGKSGRDEGAQRGEKGKGGKGEVRLEGVRETGGEIITSSHTNTEWHNMYMDDRNIVSHREVFSFRLLGFIVYNRFRC